MASSRLALLTGALLFPASGRLLQGRDVPKALAADDPCACKTWKEVYAHPANGGAECGHMGKEWYFYDKLGTYPHWEVQLMIGDEVCRKFYQRLPGNVCTNVDFSNNELTNEATQWCYVSTQCANLGVGNVLNEQVSWKSCTPEQDDMLAEKSVQELKELAVSADLDVGLLLKMAYPTWQKQIWTEVALWEHGEGTLSAEEVSNLKTLKESGKAMIFDSGESHPDKTAVLTWGNLPWKPVIGIFLNNSTYEVQYPPDMASKWAMGLAEVGQHPSGFITVVCLSNCKNFK